MNKVKTVFETIYQYELDSWDIIYINVYVIVDHKQWEIFILMESDDSNNNLEDLIHELWYDIVCNNITAYVINRVKWLNDTILNAPLKNDFKNYYINEPIKHYWYQSINVWF